MSKQIIDRKAFAKGITKVAKAQGTLFLETAWAANDSFGKRKALTAAGKPTKALLNHIAQFRDELMEGATAAERKAEDWEPNLDLPRDAWNAEGVGSDSAFRGWVTQMCHAIAGIPVLGEDAEHASFKALANAGRAVTAKQKPEKDSKDGEDTMGDLLKVAEQLMGRAPRKNPTKWDRDAIQFLGDFIAALTPESE